MLVQVRLSKPAVEAALYFHTEQEHYHAHAGSLRARETELCAAIQVFNLTNLTANVNDTLGSPKIGAVSFASVRGWARR